MCLSAIITPSETSTSPLGPINFAGPLPLMSPDERTGASNLKRIASLFEISTCVPLRTGPKIRTPLILCLVGLQHLFFFSCVLSWLA